MQNFFLHFPFFCGFVFSQLFFDFLFCVFLPFEYSGVEGRKQWYKYICKLTELDVKYDKAPFIHYYGDYKFGQVVLSDAREIEKYLNILCNSKLSC